MRTYGKEIILKNGESDGYESIDITCNECGEEGHYCEDFDKDLCMDCEHKLIEEQENNLERKIEVVE